LKKDWVGGGGVLVVFAKTVAEVARFDYSTFFNKPGAKQSGKVLSHHKPSKCWKSGYNREKVRLEVTVLK